MPDMIIDRTKPVSIYHQIVEICRENILEKFKPGDKFFSERELARVFGVSTATISRAVNELVHQGLLCRMQGKGTFVKSLELEEGTHKEENVLGIIDAFHRTDFSQDTFWGKVFKGMKKEAARQSYDLSFLTSISWETFPLEEVRKRKHIAGILLTGTLKKHEIRSLLRGGVPFVLIDYEVEGLEANCVLNDEVGGGYQATKHLINLGHKRIGCILDNQPSYLKRLEGYRAAHQDFGLDLNKELIKVLPARTAPIYEEGYLAMQDLLKLPKSPTAIFVVNDFMARGAMRAAKEKGLKIPEDLAVVSFDDIVPISPDEIPLTAVKIFVEEMGEAAVRLLINSIKGIDAKPQKIIIPTKLIVRESCGAY